MKKINTKSNCYYVSKSVFFRPFNLAKAYIIDDECGEFLCTVKTDVPLMVGYISPDEINVIDYEDFDSEKWYEMVNYIEYERAEIR